MSLIRTVKANWLWIVIVIIIAYVLFGGKTLKVPGGGMYVYLPPLTQAQKDAIKNAGNI